ncbi:hypothetical protein [Entomohabitans teleogrylli]|uniref:hypothetical protein n=1 Tax=Entomohabitans teleogrylli TaxID=1384589 RepID=UPI00073D62BD|nr:hypothetical protein [Entomohabitans teleogrylli]
MDFEIIWDDDEMEELNMLANILLKEYETEWHAFLATLETPELWTGPNEDNYFTVTKDIIDDTEGDLTNGVLSREVFISILQYEGIIESIDWKGEMEEGQLAEFVAERYGDLLKSGDASDLQMLLTHITSEKEMAKVCDTKMY